MPAFDKPLKKQKRLGGKLGLAKSAVVPTIIIKDEDITPLLNWEKSSGVPIHIWHAFFDRAYGIKFEKARSLVKKGLIEATPQVFQAPGGATTTKAIYKIYYHYAYLIAEVIEPPRLIADYIEDKNGHILPYVRFDGGALELRADIEEIL